LIGTLSPEGAESAMASAKAAPRRPAVKAVSNGSDTLEIERSRQGDRLFRHERCSALDGPSARVLPFRHWRSADGGNRPLDCTLVKITEIYGHPMRDISDSDEDLVRLVQIKESLASTGGSAMHEAHLTTRITPQDYKEAHTKSGQIVSL
jgi:hypothetical protein